MALPYTRAPSETHCASDMDGNHHAHLPSHRVCGSKFNVEHALSCPTGGFLSIRHNEIRDITANMMSKVCHAVGTEPCLQPVTDSQNCQQRRRGLLGYCGAKLWGKRWAECIFRRKGVQPIRTNLSKLQLAPELPKERTREKEGIR